MKSPVNWLVGNFAVATASPGCYVGFSRGWQNQYRDLGVSYGEVELKILVVCLFSTFFDVSPVLIDKNHLPWTVKLPATLFVVVLKCAFGVLPSLLLTWKGFKWSVLSMLSCTYRGPPRMTNRTIVEGVIQCCKLLWSVKLFEDFCLGIILLCYKTLLLSCFS